MKRVLVTGATGFTGAYVVRLLAERGYVVRCFLRPSSNAAVLPVKRIELVYGDLGDQSSLTTALAGCDVLVNIASLGFGHARPIVASAVAANIRRAVFVSTTAVETTLNAASKSIRLAAEDTVRQSELAFTILRPTMIYGSSRDRNICRLIHYVNRWPVIPIFGDGNHLQQPVYVGDVAKGVVQALESDRTIGNTYNISGASPVTYNELVETVCRLMSNRVVKVHIPTRLCVIGLRFLERFTQRFPIKAEQIQRLNEDKVFDYSAAARDFDYCPRAVTEGIAQELKEMGLLRQGS
jgi:nucleoside-diphosphate-sugar epimerase